MAREADEDATDVPIGMISSTSLMTSGSEVKGLATTPLTQTKRIVLKTPKPKPKQSATREAVRAAPVCFAPTRFPHRTAAAEEIAKAS